MEINNNNTQAVRLEFISTKKKKKNGRAKGAARDKEC